MAENIDNITAEEEVENNPLYELQIINKILDVKSDSILTLNDITADFFHEYQEELEYIQEHKQQFGNIPDKETFLSEFQEFEILQVEETDAYLIDRLREQHLYFLSVPVLNKLAELMQTDSYKAVEYLKANIDKLQIKGVAKGQNIIGQAEERLEIYKETKENKESHFIPTGFKELDEVLGGFHLGEELVVIFARTGQGKTWVSLKMLEHMWKMNKCIGLLEPEMSAIRTGYRFDTLHKNISNTNLIRGEEVKGYERYISELAEHKVPFYVAHPKDFQRKVTVSKLKSWVESNNIEVLAIDGISYLTDERMQRGDSRTSQLTNISEDLMDLSEDLGVPVIVVAQSNREGARNEDLEIENIRDSDGIAYNASIVIAVQQKEQGLQLAVKKSRNSSNNAKLTYLWQPDVGKFEYIASGTDDKEKAEEVRRRFDDDEEDF